MKKINFFVVAMVAFFASSCMLIVDLEEERWVLYNEVFNNYNARRVDIGPGRDNHLAIQIPITLNSQIRNYSLHVSYQVLNARLTAFPDIRYIRVYLFTANDYQNWRTTGAVSRNALHNAESVYRESDIFSVNIFSSDTYVLVFSNEGSLTAIMDTEITIRQRFERLE